MKFSSSLLSFAFLLIGAVTVEAHMHRKRGTPSGVYTPPPSQTPTPPTPPPPPPPPSNVVKRGLVYNDIKYTKNFPSSKFSWAYNWASSTEPGLAGGITYIPMLWDDSAEHTANWHEAAISAIANGATHLLSFNEPDLSSQADMSPQAAADAWKTYMEPLAGQAKLVAPAITNGGAPMGKAWMDDFLAACSDCTIDAIAFHMYDSATNIGYFENYITDLASRWGKPLMLTEFGASGTTQQQQQFLSQFLPWLDGFAPITHYAYFMAAPGILVNNDGSLTALGNTYATL